jgi:hypothetical protein
MNAMGMTEQRKTGNGLRDVGDSMINAVRCRRAGQIPSRNREEVASRPR